MSLEQVLIEATAAITRLTTVLISAAEAGVVTAPAAEKATRTKKAAEPVVTQAAAPVVTTQEVAATQAAAASGYLNSGDPVGTRYFHIPEHNTVYKQTPGMADCTLPGAKIVSGEQYLIEQAEIAKKFPTASAVATPVPATSEPIATAQPVIAYTFEQVVEKLRAMHKTQGDTGVAKVLAKFGVSRVPELNGKAANSDVVDFIASLGA